MCPARCPRDAELSAAFPRSLPAGCRCRRRCQPRCRAGSGVGRCPRSVPTRGRPGEGARRPRLRREPGAAPGGGRRTERCPGRAPSPGRCPAVPAAAPERAPGCLRCPGGPSRASPVAEERGRYSRSAAAHRARLGQSNPGCAKLRGSRSRSPALPLAPAARDVVPQEKLPRRSGARPKMLEKAKGGGFLPAACLHACHSLVLIL